MTTAVKFSLLKVFFLLSRKKLCDKLGKDRRDDSLFIEGNEMKRLMAFSIILALLGSILTGCSASDKSATSATSTEQVTEATYQTEENSAAISGTKEAPASTHKVEVTDQSVTTLREENGDEYKTIIPKLIVDDIEAESINSALRDHINKNHPLIKTEYGISGETTRYMWGIRGDIVSIIIIASETFTDGIGYDVFNYNVDMLQTANNDEVIKSLGMTADEFYNRVADAYRALWNSNSYLQKNMSDLDKSIGAISSKNVTPFIMPNGDIGAAGIIYVSDSQFSERVRCFDLDTLEVV